jgi:beta-fructofuranosidase
VRADPAFPGLHIRPFRGWVNDPNGVCRIDGRYHVFFQYNPAAPVHDDVHWGHVSSTDLLTWTEEPLALRPRPGAVDAGGCWSGCVVDDGGVPTAVYTGVPTTAFDAGVVLAHSDRTLREWSQEHEFRAWPPEDPMISEVRDPFLFEFEGHRYAVLGAGSVSGAPQVLIFECDDLRRWQPLGALLTTADPLAAELAPANIWECPNLFRLGDRWVLILSLWRSGDGGYVLAGVRHLIGDLTAGPDGPRFRTTAGGLVDSGPTFYAPQVLVEEHRALLWGWAWEGETRGLDEIATAGWAGVLTFPRELGLRDGSLVSRPATELTGLRQEPIAVEPGRPFDAHAFEIEASGPVRLRIAQQGVDAVVAETDGPARIFVDGSLVEVFAETTTITTRAYPGPTSRWLLEAVEATATVWRLRRPDPAPPRTD